MRLLGRVLLALALAGPAVWSSAARAALEPAGFAVLQGLDKITARISTFEARIDEPVRFGTLEITARTCRKTPPEEPPESAAFLEIVDVRPDSPAMRLFAGWMFASSPALSALEHPVYDVWVIDCRAAPAQADPAETVPEAAGPDEPVPAPEQN